MNLTTLFRLRKPEGTDPVNIEDFNDNFDAIDTELGKRPLKTDPASDMTVAFTQASSRANLTTGEKLSVSLGKIKKFFADLKTVAFSGSYADLSNKPTIPSGAAASYAVANNDTTTAAGYVADARIVQTHGLEIDQLSSDLSTAKTNFQAGVNTLYNKCVSCGVTPSAKTPAAIAAAIQSIYTASDYIIDFKGAKLKSTSFDTRLDKVGGMYFEFDATSYSTFSYVISRNTDQSSNKYFYLYISKSKDIKDKLAEYHINAGNSQGEYTGTVNVASYSGKIYIIFVQESADWTPDIRDFSLS